VNDSSDLRELVKEALISERDDTLLSYPAISGLSFDHSMELSFAKCFAVHYFKSENSDSPYKLISVPDGRNYLLVPEGGDVPGNLPKDITVLRQPLKDVYLAATGAMSLFNVLDELSLIKYTGTDISGWDIEAPREAIKSGKMTFAGKYSAPDYEMLVDGGCDLAIESTMIFHSPETKEQLEKVGIPVFIDWSSYETDALGRTEWVKLYGAMTDHENEAESFFREELRRSGLKEGFEKTGKTVAFFYFNSRGLAVVRNSDDYIPKMIRDGGGDYVFDSLKEKSDSISMDISMEEFYAAAADADYIIYNGSIDSSVETLRDLVAKNSLLSDFRAVKDSNVYIVDKEFYQSTDTVSEFARDVHLMLSGDTGGMKFLKKMQ
jgi:iron complex transport system substrate-binding protein